MQKIILDIIKKAYEIGLLVISVTCDMAGGNQAIWKLMNIGKVKRGNEIMNSIVKPCDAKSRLYFFADGPHIFKSTTQSLLNNLQITLPAYFVKKYGLKSNKVLKIHIEKLNEIQSNSNLKLARHQN